MSASGNEIADFWKQHSFLVEIGLFLSLLLLVSAAQVEWTTKKNVDEPDPPPPETITVKDITRTTQSRETPPPPTPTTSVVLPTDEIVEAREVEYDETLNLTPDQGSKEVPSPPESEQTENRPEIFTAVEQSPTLIGGMEALYQTVDYPAMAKENGIEGRVVVQFVVDEDGNVLDPTILRGAHELLNEAAIEAVKQQRFEPGKQRGRPVKVQMELPVVFQLE